MLNYFHDGRLISHCGISLPLKTVLFQIDFDLCVNAVISLTSATIIFSQIFNDMIFKGHKG